MGNYNADQTLNIQKSQWYARNFNLLSDIPVLCDQWTIDSANRVSSFHNGTRNIQLKLKADPQQIPE